MLPPGWQAPKKKTPAIHTRQASFPESATIASFMLYIFPSMSLIVMWNSTEHCRPSSVGTCQRWTHICSRAKKNIGTTNRHLRSVAFQHGFDVFPLTCHIQHGGAVLVTGRLEVGSVGDEFFDNRHVVAF